MTVRFPNSLDFRQYLNEKFSFQTHIFFIMCQKSKVFVQISDIFVSCLKSGHFCLDFRQGVKPDAQKFGFQTFNKRALAQPYKKEKHINMIVLQSDLD